MSSEGLKLAWDYSPLAKFYAKRPGYPEQIIDRIASHINLGQEWSVCDIGAGTGNLTSLLSEYANSVIAVEPNSAMRAEGLRATSSKVNVHWIAATGENTGLETGAVDLAAFGSSFNVVDLSLALPEAKRICRPGGWLLAIWNYRDLDDPIQQKIERAIKQLLPDYSLGSRRSNWELFLNETGAFSSVTEFSHKTIHRQAPDDILEAWRSHATLARQAGHLFPAVLAEIECILAPYAGSAVSVPYTSKAWAAQFR